VGGNRGRRRGVGNLVVGRLCTPSPRKWPAWLPDFYRDLTRSVPSARWEFVGCPQSLHAELRRACDGRARFHDASWSARSLLWTWDVLCYSNPDLPESFGRVCAEAMRTGCVPVVDDQGGFREQVEDGRSGFLCGDTHQFAEALRQLTDPAIRSQIASAASCRADEQFSVAAFADRLRKWMEVATRIH
jgi:glycosyltransferase involved in cell wall biosynthesis